MRSHRRHRLTVVVALAASALLAACAGDVSVTAERSDQIVLETPVPETPPEPNDPPAPSTDPDEPDPTEPPSVPAPSVPEVSPDEIDPAAIDFGSNKPRRPYDDFLLAVITDLDAWWTAQYPAIYGDQFRSLDGGVFAGYADRPDDLPGCGTPRTSYEEIQTFGAFYCGIGDYIVYDDGDSGLLAQLAAEYGPSTIAIVFAHEFGHAIQMRAGELDRNLSTVYTEQQADCFAGAWAARVSSGQSNIVAFTDADVRSGLIAMTKVSDPVGLDQFVPGGHGSAFDRVGAFQVGFLEGAARCSDLLDDPLPLVPNEFSNYDLQFGVDAPFGYGDEQLLNFIPTDLGRYWNGDVSAEAGNPGEITLVGAETAAEIDCDVPDGAFERGAVFCASSRTVFLNEPKAAAVYESLGDFSVGYLVGSAWSEAVLLALGSELAGETRALAADCLTGAWVKTVLPVNGALPEPRGANRDVRVSPGDLDEAIQTVLHVADENSDDDRIGNAFEKIDAFRQGVLGGLDTCLADL